MKKALVTMLTIILMVAGCSNSNSNRADIAEETSDSANTDDSEDLTAESSEEKPSTESIIKSVDSAESLRDSAFEAFSSLPEWEDDTDPLELCKRHPFKEDAFFCINNDDSTTVNLFDNTTVFFLLEEDGGIIGPIPICTKYSEWANAHSLKFDGFPSVFSAGDTFVLLAITDENRLIQVTFTWEEILGCDFLGEV